MSKWVVLILRSAKYVCASLLCSANIFGYSGMPRQQLSADTATLLKPHFAACKDVPLYTLQETVVAAVPEGMPQPGQLWPKRLVLGLAVDLSWPLS